MAKDQPLNIVFHSLHLASAEKLLCQNALDRSNTLDEAADLLGLDRHSLKRRIIKHNLEWPRPAVKTTKR